MAALPVSSVDLGVIVGYLRIFAASSFCQARNSMLIAIFVWIATTG